MAEAFQMFVLVVAAIGLILSLTVVALMIKRQNKAQWPPVVPDCPDWWKSSLDSNGNVVCTNVQNLGTCPGPFYPNSSQYTGADGACNKYTWATNCGIQWDGITYGVDNPCASS